MDLLRAESRRASGSLLSVSSQDWTIWLMPDLLPHVYDQYFPPARGPLGHLISNIKALWCGHYLLHLAFAR